MPDHDAFRELLDIVAQGTALSKEQAREAFALMMSGAATPSQMGGFLMALRVRGETIDEITGAAETLRAQALKVHAPDGALDTCGTGGDSSGSYNISTAAALIIAACGVPVAKHGNYALSSRSGSANVLAELGVNIEAEVPVIERCLEQANIGFLMAPLHHQATRFVAPTRAELGTRTIFNLLGPLSNPAGTKRQLSGVFAQKWAIPMAEVMRNLGIERAWIAHGADGLDELTTTGPTFIAVLNRGQITSLEVTPEDAGLPRARPQDLRGGSPAVNAQALRQVLEGRPSPYRDIALLNAAAGLIVAEVTENLREGVQMAAEAIDLGLAAATLDKLARISQEPVAA